MCFTVLLKVETGAPGKQQLTFHKQNVLSYIAPSDA